ncbi:MAG: DUF505 domain-containing protein [Candidatus Diapherotrites archaeon]|nr:DUF505 domain-containing protein [Candidatus Diapherotrites archaeon]
MYVRKRHVEMLKRLKEGEKVRGIQFLELYIQGFITKDGRLTPAGELIARLEPKDELFIASDTVKEAELYVKTGFIPEEWKKDLESRGLSVEDLPFIYEAYEKAKPVVMLTPYVISFIEEIPPAGDYDELIRFKDMKDYGHNVVNALQAMRLLFISPPKKGRRTYALSGGARRIPEFAFSLTETVFIGEEEMEKLEKEIRDESLVRYGLQTEEGKLTEMGERLVSALREKHPYVRPVYLGENELDALKKMADWQERYSDEKDRIRRVKKEFPGELLRLLQFRGLITDDYKVTPEGKKAIEYGVTTVDGMRAVVFSLMGDPPAYDWLEKAREEGLFHWWITSKAEFFLDLGRQAIKFPYITKYDTAILAHIPRRRYVTVEDLMRAVEEKVGRYDRAIGEAETKGLIRVFQNDSVRLTEFGEKMKEVVEYANLPELLNTSLAITPETWKIIRALYENEEEVNYIWKKADENRKDYYQELAKFVAKVTRMDEEEVLKFMKLLHITGFLGSKYLTEAGRKLAEVLDVRVEGS